jgi:hypothetical protein
VQEVPPDVEVDMAQMELELGDAYAAVAEDFDEWEQLQEEQNFEEWHDMAWATYVSGYYPPGGAYDGQPWWTDLQCTVPDPPPPTPPTPPASTAEDHSTTIPPPPADAVTPHAVHCRRCTSLYG